MKSVKSYGRFAFLFFIGMVQFIIGIAVMLTAFNDLDNSDYYTFLGIFIAFPTIIPLTFGVLFASGSVEANDQEVVIKGTCFIRPRGSYNQPIRLKYTEISKIEHDYNSITLVDNYNVKLIVNCIKNSDELYNYIYERLLIISKKQNINNSPSIYDDPINTQYQANPYFYTNQTTVKEEHTPSQESRLLTDEQTQALINYKKLYDNGIISYEEYIQKKTEILNK